MVTKKEIAESVCKFITNELMAEIDNRHTKFALSMAKKSLRENPEILDCFFDSPLVASVVKKDGDSYNVETLAKIMKNILAEYESYSITIPKIPIFSPHESVIEITSADLDKMLSYLHSEESMASA